MQIKLNIHSCALLVNTNLTYKTKMVPNNLNMSVLVSMKKPTSEYLRIVPRKPNWRYSGEAAGQDTHLPTLLQN